jgi:hypothetical protein
MKEKKYSWCEMELMLEDSQIATQDEIDLVCKINGYNEKTMEDILYVRTGYRCFEWLEEA